MGEHQGGKKYRILEPLGEGGMGVVYRAVHSELGSEVAIKFLTDEAAQSSPTARARFLREAKACVALAHPNVIKIIDVGEEDGHPFFVMELLKAKDLLEVERARGPLSADLAISILDNMLDALAYCHGKGFIHRDIKPSNIMLDESGRAVLMDFGLVKSMERTVLTEAGKVLGTPSYLAPEVLKGKPPSVAADLWSLGVTLWEVLVGRPLFAGEGLNEVLKNILQQEILPIGRLRTDIPARVRPVIDRLLERDLSRRWTTAAQARRALRQAVGTDAGDGADAPEAGEAREARDAREAGAPREDADPGGAGEGREAGGGRPGLSPTRSRPVSSAAIPRLPTRPSRPLTASRAIPVQPRPLPRAGMLLALAASSLAVLAALWFASWRRGPAVASPGSGAQPVSAPVCRDIRFTYPDLDRLRIQFTTEVAGRFRVRASGASSPVETSPGTDHSLEIRVAPAEGLEEVLIVADGPVAPVVARPPPPPGLLARQLAQDVRAAGFTDEAVDAATLPLFKAISKRKAPVGDALGQILGEYPSQVALIDALVHRLETQGGLEATWASLRPHVARLLASPAVAATERFALLGALDRLQLADNLLVFLGRPAPFRVAEAMSPTFCVTVSPGEVKDPTAKPDDAEIPMASPDRVYGRAIDLPPGVSGDPPSELLFPPRGVTHFWLIPKGINPPKEVDQYRIMLGQEASDEDRGPTLRFSTTRAAGPRGLRLHMRTLKLLPEVAIVLTPPGAPGDIMLRKPLEPYDRKLDRIWHTITFRGAMVPPPGRWTFGIRKSFQSAFFPNLKIEKIVAEPLP